MLLFSGHCVDSTTLTWHHAGSAQMHAMYANSLTTASMCRSTQKVVYNNDRPDNIYTMMCSNSLTPTASRCLSTQKVVYNNVRLYVQ